MEEDSVCSFYDTYNALISHFLHVPFPEQLDDDTWIEKARQVKWLESKGILPVKFIKN